MRLKTTLIVASAIAVAVLIFAWNQPKLGPLMAAQHSVTITWNATPGAQFYYVYRSTVSGSQYQKIGSSPTNSYKDSPVPGKSTFYYVVTAVNDKGESKYSSEIKAVVP
jgi:fibronectin type 3 domain-containing protein